MAEECGGLLSNLTGHREKRQALKEREREREREIEGGIVVIVEL